MCTLNEPMRLWEAGGRPQPAYFTDANEGYLILNGRRRPVNAGAHGARSQAKDVMSSYGMATGAGSAIWPSAIAIIVTVLAAATSQIHL